MVVDEAAVMQATLMPQGILQLPGLSVPVHGVSEKVLMRYSEPAVIQHYDDLVSM